MKKQIRLLLGCVCIVILVFAFYIEGKTGNYVKGKAADSDFLITNGILSKYTGSASDIVIPDGVTEIKNTAFWKNTAITSVVIPKSVKKIGASAFAECSNLKMAVLPETLTEIPREALEMFQSINYEDKRELLVFKVYSFSTLEKNKKYDDTQSSETPYSIEIEKTKRTINLYAVASAKFQIVS